MQHDLYEILGVPSDADDHVLRAAYRSAAKRLHPDSGSVDSDSEAMRELNLAFEILSDQKKRDDYDNDARSAGLTIDELGKLFDLDDLEPKLSNLPRYKLAALNREIVALEAEGWNVERRHDHLSCTRLAKFSWRRPRTRREIRMSVSVDEDGLVHRTIQ